VKPNKQGIFGPNRCAIAHSFGVDRGPGVPWAENRPRHAREVGIVLVWSVCLFEAIWVVKRAKQWEWGIVRPNRYSIAYGFGGGPEVQGCLILGVFIHIRTIIYPYFSYV